MGTFMNSSEHLKVDENIFLHIRDWGRGETIVFIPGWPFGHEMFEYQFNRIPQQGYRCIGISMRGFGRSSQPWGEYTYDVFADDLHTVLNSLNLNNVTLVGFSMGGATAIRYMARHKGDRVSNLVLCGAAAPTFTRRADFPFGLQTGAVDRLIELCRSDRARLTAEFGRIFFKDSAAVSPELSDWFRTLAMEASPQATAACLATLRDSDLRQDLKSITVPTMILHGMHDRVCPIELAENMTAAIDPMPTGAKGMAAGEDLAVSGICGAKLIRFENSGHALFYEERDRFNSELVNFIEKRSCNDKTFFPL